MTTTKMTQGWETRVTTVMKALAVQMAMTDTKLMMPR